MSVHEEEVKFWPELSMSGKAGSNEGVRGSGDFLEALGEMAAATGLIICDDCAGIGIEQELIVRACIEVSDFNNSNS